MYFLCRSRDPSEWITEIQGSRREIIVIARRCRPTPSTKKDACTKAHASISATASHVQSVAATQAATDGTWDAVAPPAPSGKPATRWHIADTRLEVLAGGLLWVRWAFEVIDSPELAALLRDRADAFAAAAGGIA